MDFTALCITMQLPHSATLVAQNFTDYHGIYSLEWICDGSTINLLDSLEVWVQDVARSLRCVIGQDTSLSPCLSPSRGVNGYQLTVRES